MSDIKWLLEPFEDVKGSGLPFIGYRFIKALDPSYNSESEMMILFKEIFASGNVSDIYIATDKPVIIQLKGEGLKAATPAILSNHQARSLVETILGSKTAFVNVGNRQTVGGSVQITLERENEKEVKTYAFDNNGNRVVHSKSKNLTYNKSSTNFRWNLSGCMGDVERNGFVFVMRPLSEKPPHYADLGIELQFVQDFIQPDGICIIAGATGQGKSTTLSANIRYMMENDTLLKGTFITLEDPIEIRYSLVRSTHTTVYQKQIGYGGHLEDFAVGIHAAMRESPSLILVGELRNRASIDTAIEASLTGHTVYATVHATNVGAILPRLLSQVDKDDVGRVLDSLRVLSAQKLITLTNGKRTTVREWLVLTPALRNALSKYIDDPLLLGAKIRQIVDKQMYGAVNFRTQAEKLREQGLINERNYNRLCVEETLSKEELAMLESLTEA